MLFVRDRNRGVSLVHCDCVSLFSRRRECWKALFRNSFIFLRSARTTSTRMGFKTTTLRCLSGSRFLTRRNNGDGGCIPCAYVKASCPPRYTLLYSHANAEDLGNLSVLFSFSDRRSIPFFLWLSKCLFVDVVGYDYPGYGKCTYAVAHSSSL